MALFAGRSSARAATSARSLPDPSSPASSPAAVRLPTARWRDLRVLAGLAIVVACVLVGVRVVSAADDRVLIWQATRDLATGTPVSAADLVAVPVGLDPAGSSYLAADRRPEGVLTRDIAAGELLPASAVGAVGAPDLRLVTLPVEPLHGLEGLAPGDRVDVWATAREDIDAGSAQPRRVLSQVVVAGVSGGDTGLGGEAGVLVQVRPQAVAALIAAARSGAIDLVRTPAMADS